LVVRPEEVRLVEVRPEVVQHVADPEADPEVDPEAGPWEVALPPSEGLAAWEIEHTAREQARTGLVAVQCYVVAACLHRWGQERAEFLEQARIGL
jgi:hypothetical protein